MNKRVIVRCLLIATIMLIAIPTAVQAHHAWVYAGYELHWPGSHSPINLELVDHTARAWQPITLDAAKDWNAANSLNVARNHSGSCSLTSQCIEVFAGDYGANGWLGLGGGWIEYDAASDQIHWILGGAWMNDYYFDNRPFYNTLEWRNVVMCQEIGHALGLGHNDENFYNPPTGTCMDYSIDPSSNQNPDAHDYAVLDAIHAHQDAFTPPAGPPIIPPGITSGQWGELVRSNGAVSMYARDMGDNQTWVTFVTWVQE